MLIATIILVILIGIVLLVLEILVLPGLVAGIIGAILIITGILWMYKDFGSTAGHYTTLATVALSIGAVYYSLKSQAWQRFGLKDSLQGRANEIDKTEIKEGDEGLSISALRPMGTIMVNNIRVEAQTNGEMISGNTEVIVIKVLTNKVIVKEKQKNTNL